MPAQFLAPNRTPRVVLQYTPGQPEGSLCSAADRRDRGSTAKPSQASFPAYPPHPPTVSLLSSSEAPASPQPHSFPLSNLTLLVSKIFARRSLGPVQLRIARRSGIRENETTGPSCTNLPKPTRRRSRTFLLSLIRLAKCSSVWNDSDSANTAASVVGRTVSSRKRWARRCSGTSLKRWISPDR